MANLDLEAAQDGEEKDAPFNQASIDDFLGFGGFGGPAQSQSGIDALVHAPTVPYERIPMLEAVFDRLVKLLRISARKITSDIVEVRLDRITSLRFGQYLDSISLPSLIGVTKAQPWNNFGLVVVDSSLVYSLIDVVFGGNASLSPPAVEGRSFSSIEMNMLRRFFEAVLSDTKEAFSSISPVDFVLDHFETNPRFASITQPQNIVALATFKVELGTLQGFFDIVLPFVTLEPIREALSLSYVGDRLGQDDVWQQHLVSEVSRSEVSLTAVLHEEMLPLGRVLNLAVGDTLMFDIGPDNPVELRCADVLVTRGRMGRAGNNVAVKLVQSVTNPQYEIEPHA
ncbi:MAG: fliM [Enterovirga sp.]|jgi:flagellar motor switch protein FliM|nr:fliM [Enterovirga sp.]